MPFMASSLRSASNCSSGFMMCMQDILAGCDAMYLRPACVSNALLAKSLLALPTTSRVHQGYGSGFACWRLQAARSSSLASAKRRVAYKVWSVSFVLRGYVLSTAGGAFQFNGVSQPEVAYKANAIRTTARGVRHVSFPDGQRIEVSYPYYILRGAPLVIVQCHRGEAGLEIGLGVLRME